MYISKLSVIQTESAIKEIKDIFETSLSRALGLRRVSAPLFVDAASGLNDRLTGKERPLSFGYSGTTIEIVQSLAKWKRQALYYYGFDTHTGLYTDMNAIRPSETLDATHSLYVDQWDWEKVIKASDRTTDYLRQEVRKIYSSIRHVEQRLIQKYPDISQKLPETLFFIDSETLRQKYPELTPEKREKQITKEKQAVFIERIGMNLGDGAPHDQRSPDYDDWKLNGDLLLWHDPLGIPLEISSMGIRVDKKSLRAQLNHFPQWNTTDFHTNILNGTLPLTIGGGIGQSRLCQFILEKKHIGEVQASYWPGHIIDDCKRNNINLL